MLSRSGHQKRDQKHKRNNCERCGSEDRLQVHHQDKDWSNDDPDNFQTLCATCHMKLHHANGDIVKAGPKDCKHCGRKTTGRSVCETCRTRIKKYGDPLVGQVWDSRQAAFIRLVERALR